MKFLCISLIYVLIAFPAIGQSNIDSLEKIVSLSRKDVAEATALNKLAEIYSRKDFAKSRVYLDAAYKVAIGLKTQKPLSITYFQLISLFQNTGNADSATFFLKRLETLSQQAPGDEKGGINIDYYQAAGLYYKRSGDMKKAIVFYQKALEQMLLEKRNTQSVAGVYLNMGNAYSGLGHYKEALQNHLKALDIFESIHNDLGMSFCYQSISDSYREMKQYEKSLAYAQKSLAIKLALNDKRAISTSYNTLGNNYMGLEDYEKALSYFEKYLQIAVEMNMLIDQQKALFNIGKTYSLKNDIAKATDYFKQSKALADKSNNSSMVILVDAELNSLNHREKDTSGFELKVENSLQVLQEKGDLKTKMEFYKSTAEYYTAKKDFEKALIFTKKYYELIDSIKSKDVQVQVRQMEAQFNSDKKENEIAILKKDNALNEANLQREKAFKYSAFLISLLLLLIGLFIFKRIRLGQQMKELKLRNQIAADLHDEVGSSLSSIHLLSQLAERNEMGKASKSILNKMTSNVQETMEKMSDIVWMVKPRHNDMLSLQNRMENFVFELCAGKEIECNFKSDDMGQIDLNMEQRKNIYLIFKEAVNNAVKYAGSDKLDVTISFTNNVLKMCIKDYGAGFDINAATHGNGLENMRNRAKEINGKIDIISLPSKGTQIDLQVNI